MKLGNLLTAWARLHYPFVDVNEGDIVFVVNAIGDPVIGIVEIDHSIIKVKQKLEDGTLSRGQEVWNEHQWNKLCSSAAMTQLRKL